MTHGRRHDPEHVLEVVDPWARGFLAELRAAPGLWRGRLVWSGRAGDDQAAEVDRGLSRFERAAQRSLFWNHGHAASSGARIRPETSLMVAWGPPRLEDGHRTRMLTARVMTREAGRAFYAERARPAKR
jgi:hypothetical protein